MNDCVIHAIYPGSFDPVTLGHLDIVRRALGVFGQLTVAILENSEKEGLFSFAERREIFREAIADAGLEGVDVVQFSGLLTEFAERIGARTVVRGLRAVSDFEYELQMAQMNRRLSPHLETVFMTPSEELSFISSGLVREIARFGGDISGLVPRSAAERLAARFRDGAGGAADDRRGKR